MLAEYTGVLVLLVLALLVTGAMLGLHLLLGPRRRFAEKQEPFECGEKQIVSPRQRYAVKFYMVAILFVIFDVEAIFFYPWAAVFGEIGSFGFFAMAVFTVPLAVGLAYEWLKGGLDSVISPPTRNRIEAEIEKYPARRGALLPALHLVQAELGYVSPEAAVELAEIFGILPGQLLEVVSFYNMLHTTPQPRHHVNVCTNLPCSLRGARGLLRGLEAHLGIETGRATPDGRIGLGTEECLGACGYAPMMRVDDRYHENLDLDQARRILDELE